MFLNANYKVTLNYKKSKRSLARKGKYNLLHLKVSTDSITVFPNSFPKNKNKKGVCKYVLSMFLQKWFQP